jgi:hypothetical protein
MAKQHRTVEEIDREIEILDNLDRFLAERQRKLLMKLNKRDLKILAMHYQIPNLQVYFDDGWMHGGKEELCREIVSAMMP